MIDKKKIKISDFICEKIVELGISEAFLVTGGGAMHLNDSITKHNMNIQLTHFI